MAPQKMPSGFSDARLLNASFAWIARTLEIAGDFIVWMHFVVALHRSLAAHNFVRLSDGGARALCSIGQIVTANDSVCSDRRHLSAQHFCAESTRALILSWRRES
jgi:hypothetical protein